MFRAKKEKQTKPTLLVKMQTIARNEVMETERLRIQKEYGGNVVMLNSNEELVSLI